MVSRHGQQQIGVGGVKLELVDALAVAHVVLDAVHGGRAEDANDSPGAGGRQQRLARVRIVRPGARVEVLVSVRIRVTLQTRTLPCNIAL